MLLLGYRISNHDIYIGFLGGYGVSDTTTLTHTLADGTQTEYTGQSATNQLIAFDGGVRSKSVGIGVEMGYLVSTLTSLDASGTTLNDSEGNPIPLTLSGVYARFVFSLYF